MICRFESGFRKSPHYPCSHKITISTACFAPDLDRRFVVRSSEEPGPGGLGAWHLPKSHQSEIDVDSQADVVWRIPLVFLCWPQIAFVGFRVWARKLVVSCKYREPLVFFSGPGRRVSVIRWEERAGHYFTAVCSCCSARLCRPRFASKELFRIAHHSAKISDSIARWRA